VAACLDRRPARRRAARASSAVNNHWTEGGAARSPRAAARPCLRGGRARRLAGREERSERQRGASRQLGDRSEEQVVAELAGGRARALRGRACGPLAAQQPGLMPCSRLCCAQPLLQDCMSPGVHPLHALQATPLKCCTCMGTAMTRQTQQTWTRLACKLPAHARKCVTPAVPWSAAPALLENDMQGGSIVLQSAPACSSRTAAAARTRRSCWAGTGLRGRGPRSDVCSRLPALPPLLPVCRLSRSWCPAAGIKHAVLHGPGGRHPQPQSDYKAAVKNT
jgi:hypothetical protein